MANKFHLPFINNVSVKQGYFLLSDPFLQDPYFERSVVFLCEHNENGSFGFVLNNYVDIKLTDVCEIPLQLNNKLSVGGPVLPKTLFFLHRFGNNILDSLNCGQDIYCSNDIDSLIDFSKQHEKSLQNKIRFFFGYSGWSSGQLNEEMASHSWIAVKNIPVDFIFNSNDTKLWERCMQLQGPKFSMISKFPLNPQEN